MRVLPNQRHLIIGGLLAAVLLCIGGGWWLVERSDAIPFLPGRAGAEWVVYPEAAGAEIRPATADVVWFRRDFDLPTPPEQAALSCRAFRRAAVSVNGVVVRGLELDGRGWKRGREADVTGLLRAGPNRIEVAVTNTGGPPALWLRLRIGEKLLATDATWQALRAQLPWRNARLARQPPPIEPGGYLAGQEPLPGLVKRAAVPLAVAGLLTWLGVGLANRLQRRPAGCIAGRWRERLRQPALVLVVLSLVWAALFVNNLPQLPRLFGFDTEGHEQYIQHIQEQSALPLATEGWQMYQPPLYYVAGAVVLGLADLTPADESAALLLRAANGLVGLGHCALVFLCLRLLFPGQGWKQVVGTLFAGLLPAHLLLAHYVTNEVLAAAFVTAAIYFCLRTVCSGSAPTSARAGNAAITGLLLGLALLTKFSAVLAVPVLAGVLALHRPDDARLDWRPGLGRAGLMLGVAGLVSGWHYARVWAQLGRPLVGNWDAASGFAWWQAPGYRTADYYLGFGEALVRPLFSSFGSFWDGLYATLWGDGLVSSAAWLAFRPPWNYDLMGAAWWLAVPGTTLVLLGVAAGAVRLVRRLDPVRLLLLGLLAAFGLGLLYMSLRVPSYAQVKAFYALPALLPLTVALLEGWDRLAQRRGWLLHALGVWFATWAVAVAGAFWVRSNNPETAVVQGIWALDRGRVSEAVGHYERALRLDARHWTVGAALTEAVRVAPGESALRLLLAECLDAQGRYADAAGQYRELLRLQPDEIAALNNLAWLLATCPDAGLLDGDEAVRLAERACELTDRKDPLLLGTLAAAYARAGRFDEAVQTATAARDLAVHTGQGDLAARNDALLGLYRAGKAFQDQR